MKGHRVPIVLCCLVFTLAFCAGALGDYLTPEQMYLDPATVPADLYTYEYFVAGYSHTFLNVKGLQILPPLLEGSLDYYFTPAVDYTADITNGVGTVQFIRPGPYFVRALYEDGTSQLFDFGIGFDVFSNGEKTYNWHRIPTPNPDVVAVDPDLVRSEPKHNPKTVVVAPTSWGGTH